MKKYMYLLVLVIFASSCGTNRYAPSQAEAYKSKVNFTEKNSTQSIQSVKRKTIARKNIPQEKIIVYKVTEIRPSLLENIISDALYFYGNRLYFGNNFYNLHRRRFRLRSRRWQRNADYRRGFISVKRDFYRSLWSNQRFSSRFQIINPLIIP